MSKFIKTLLCLLIASELASAQTPATNTPSKLGAPASLQPLMKENINPAARALWNAVSYVVSVEGTKETAPSTNEDWAQLRKQADVLIEAGFLLKAPNLVIATSADTKDFQFTASEIADLRKLRGREWNSFIDQQQSTVLEIIKSIEQRDIANYTEAGARLNQSCEGCHAQFWYRPLPMPGNEAER